MRANRPLEYQGNTSSRLQTPNQHKKVPATNPIVLALPSGIALADKDRHPEPGHPREFLRMIALDYCRGSTDNAWRFRINFRGEF